WGESLEKRLEAANAPLLETDVLKWAIQLCEALHYLHSRQPAIIFRDMKPSNVMVTNTGLVKLIDFGIARTYKMGKKRDTVAMGSENYAAPEAETIEALSEEAASEAEAMEALSEEALPEVEAETPPLEEPGPEAEAVETPTEEPLIADHLPQTVTADEDADATAAADAGASAGVEEGTEPEVEESSSEPAHEPRLEVEEAIAPAGLEEAQLLEPVAPGTLIAGRYVVVEALDVREGEILYHARDLRRCWQCGFEGNIPDDAFCAQCGAALDRRTDVQLLEVQDALAEPPGETVVAARLSDAGRTFLLLAEAQSEAEVVPEPQSVQLLVGQRSDAGQVRELNEDSLLVLAMAPTYESLSAPALGLFSVADGMGGHEGGEVASRLALQVLAQEVLRTIISSELADDLAPEQAIIAQLEKATIAANDAVYLARQKRDNDMGTTLTSALIRNDQLFLAHVGDCRAYRWNSDGLQQLTTDHSLVASMVASGQAQPDEIYTHPHRSVIYRCIGDQPVVEVDTSVVSLAAGDRILICSDGLWEMIRNEGIQDVMLQEADPQAACDRLVKHANMAGGEDNISVIVIQVGTM
ncbi:protein phosphatase 2C domain-containing protein, partial [Chloroflexota bacterium]